MRRLLPLVAGFLVLAAAAGCASDGRPTAGGDVAAVVGTDTVGVSLVQERLRTSAPDLAAALEQRAAQAPAGAPGAGSGRPDAETLAARSRTLLTEAVLHRLVAVAGARQGIVVTPEQVTAVLAPAGGAAAAAAGSGYDAATVRELTADSLVLAELGRRVFDRLAVTLDYAAVDDRAAADALAVRIAADPAAGVLAGLPPDRATAGLVLRPGSDPGGGPGAAAASLLFGLPAGTVTVTPAARTPADGAAPDPAAGPWTVIHVRSRTLDAPPPGPGVIPAAQVDQETITGFGLRQLQPLARELGVAVNPRFGVWDPSQLQVVATAAAAGTVRPVAPVPTPAPAP